MGSGSGQPSRGIALVNTRPAKTEGVTIPRSFAVRSWRLYQAVGWLCASRVRDLRTSTHTGTHKPCTLSDQATALTDRFAPVANANACITITDMMECTHSFILPRTRTWSRRRNALSLLLTLSIALRRA